MEKLLIINPGSTSTKIVVYDGETPLFVENISHSKEEVSRYDNIADQYEFRRDLLLEAMQRHGISTSDLTAIVSRGGLLPPIETGAYKVNDDMVWQLRYAPINNHASNLGAIIADAIAKELSINNLTIWCLSDTYKKIVLGVFLCMKYWRIKSNR